MNFILKLSFIVILAMLTLLNSFDIQRILAIKKNNLKNKFLGNRLPFRVDRKHIFTFSTYTKFSSKLFSSEDDEFKTELRKIENKIEKCEEDIKICQAAIISIESKILNSTDVAEKDYLMKKEDYLMKKEDYLRKEKDHLMKKEDYVMKKETDLSMERSALTKMEDYLTKKEADLTNALNKIEEREIVNDIKENIIKGNLSDDGSFLELPNTTKFYKVPPVKSLYIRNEFTELYNLMTERLSLPDTSNDYKQNFVITGTPGIGKSSLLFFLLWKFFTGNSPQDEIWKDREIFYQISSTEIFHLKSNNRVVVYNTQTCKSVMDERSVLIADMTEAVAPIYHLGITIVLSSPNELRFKELLKRKDSLQLFMNVWTREEINKVWEHSYKDKLSEERVNYAYNKLGGVIRYVLEKNENCDEILNQAFGKYANNFRELAKSALASTNVKDADISYTLLHYVSTQANHQDGKLQFASLHIFEEIVKNIQSDDTELVLQFCGASQYPQLQSYVGIKFEEFVHEIIPKNGLQIVKRLMPGRNLSKKAQKNFDKYGISLKFNYSILGNKTVNSKAILSDFKKGDNTIIDDNVYYRPKISNFASSDSFIIIGNDVFFLQITVGKKHEVKQSGLIYLVEYLENKFPGRKFHYHIVFICPKNRVNTNNFNIQSIVNLSFGDLKKSSANVRPFVFNQWLAEVEFQDTLMMTLLDKKQ